MGDKLVRVGNNQDRVERADGQTVHLTQQGSIEKGSTYKTGRAGDITYISKQTEKK